MNDQIQSNLRLSGELSGPEVTIKTLTPQNFTQAEAREISSYRAGDIVVTPVAPAGSEITANTLYTVSGINRQDRILTLTSPDGDKLSIELQGSGRSTPKLAVFKSDQQTFITGDQVKFKITDRTHGIFNSAEGTLRSIGKDEVEIQTKDGERLSIPTDSLAAKGMQLAYAATAHDFQGSTVDRVMLGMIAKEQLTTQKSFYVGLSRMRDSIHLITDDLAKLTSQISDQTGERMNALEALAQDRDAAKSEEEKRQNEQTKSERTERDIQPEKADQKPPQKDADRDTKNRTGDDPEKGEQSTFMDKLINTLNLDQKQRDERSR